MLKMNLSLLLPNYDTEGLVLKTPNGLRNGERLILKIKTKDFRALQNKL